MIEHVQGVEAARDLAATLNSRDRAAPIAVVTIPAGRESPFLDVERIYDEVGDLVPVRVMATGPLTWAFAEQMPDGTEVYGGAGRVYPTGHAWVHEPAAAPLRMAFSSSEGRRSTEALISDALGMAFTAGLVGATVSTTAEVVRGEVLGFRAGRGLVRLTDGRSASVVPELTVAGVPLERLLEPGMPVQGTLDAGRLDIRASVLAPAALPYGPGDIVLVRVGAVETDSAELWLHPELPVRVFREDVTGNPYDSLDSLMSVDEVLRARVTATSPWRLALHDLDDDEEAVPAITLLDGGPPWLVEGLPDAGPDELIDEEESPTARLDVLAQEVTPEAHDGQRVPAPRQGVPPGPAPTPALLDRRGRRRRAEPVSTAGASAATEAAPAPPRRRDKIKAKEAEPLIAKLRAELTEREQALETAQTITRGLQTELEILRKERAKATNERNHVRGEAARLKKKLRSSRSGSGPEKAERQAQFLDPEQQFRHEVYVAWADRIAPAEKEARPRCPYTIGPDFLATLQSTEGVSRAKVVDVVVELLTGIAFEQAGRDVHQLRSSDGGGSKQRERADGARAWRLALQDHTPSARRLHYWRLTDGSIELARVCKHDDYRA